MALFWTFGLAIIIPLAYNHGSFGQSGPQLCSKDADCSNGQRCVAHYNLSSIVNCDGGKKYCISVMEDSCSCRQNLTCRPKDCPASPFECIPPAVASAICGGDKGPNCTTDEVCGYKQTGLVCVQCPCPSFRPACVIRNPNVECGPNSVIRIISNSNYTCHGCASIVDLFS
ncbi:uncharacterized protein LOC144149146 [Haemaphysalis longicornis]